MFRGSRKRVDIKTTADWYRIEPEHAAWVEELVIASSVGDQFVIGEDDIDIVHSFPRLKHLSVWKSLSGNEWNHIAGLSLRTLRVYVDTLPERIAMPELRELNISVREAALTPMEIEVLRAGGARRKIDLSGCPDLEWLTIRHVPDLDIGCFTRIPSLKKLVLYGTVLSDPSQLNNLSLTSVSLIQCYLNTISGLEQVNTLQNVDLSYNEIETAAALCALPSLQKLNLRKNPLKDEAAVRNLFRGQELIISEHDYLVKRIQTDISSMKLFAGRDLYNDLRKSVSTAPGNLRDRALAQKLMEWDYTELIKDRIASLARRGLKQLRDKSIQNADGFDYTEYYINTLRETYPFLKDEELNM